MQKLVISVPARFYRAISLGVRLAANISAGHLLFAILSGFAFNMLSSGMIILSFLPMLIMIFITLLEITHVRIVTSDNTLTLFQTLITVAECSSCCALAS